MLDGYYNAFWFLVIGVLFVALNLWISSLIRPSDPHAEAAALRVWRRVEWHRLRAFQSFLYYRLSNF